jgi:hypothetical protein
MQKITKKVSVLCRFFIQNPKQNLRHPLWLADVLAQVLKHDAAGNREATPLSII